MTAFRTPVAISITAEQEIKCLLTKGFTREMLEEALASFAPVSNDGQDASAREWTKFYRKVFGLEVDFSGVTIPDEQPGFGLVVVVAKGLTLNCVWSKCRELFPTYSYFGDDMDKVVTKNDRTSQTAYAKRFRDRVEADEELKNLSANQCAEQGIRGITLLERLLLELWYFSQIGEDHLDLQNITLCAGSRYGGDVPSVDWYNGRLKVGYCHPGYRGDDLRTRAAV